MPKKSTHASRAVDMIISDLSGRRGLGDEWDNIDGKTQREIRAKWAQIVRDIHAEPPQKWDETPTGSNHAVGRT